MYRYIKTEHSVGLAFVSVFNEIPVPVHTLNIHRCLLPAKYVGKQKLRRGRGGKRRVLTFCFHFVAESAWPDDLLSRPDSRNLPSPREPMASEKCNKNIITMKGGMSITYKQYSKHTVLMWAATAPAAVAIGISKTYFLFVVFWCKNVNLLQWQKFIKKIVSKIIFLNQIVFQELCH